MVEEAEERPEIVYEISPDLIREKVRYSPKEKHLNYFPEFIAFRSVNWCKV